MSCERKSNGLGGQDYAVKMDLEVIDYSIDYCDDLAEIEPADTLVGSTWSVSPAGGLTITDGTQFTDTTTSVWVSGGGRNGMIYRLKNTATSAGGRSFVRVLVVRMANKLAYIEAEDPVTIPTE
jgi:hypothetical protein